MSNPLVYAIIPANRGMGSKHGIPWKTDVEAPPNMRSAPRFIASHGPVYKNQFSHPEKVLCMYKMKEGGILSDIPLHIRRIVSSTPRRRSLFSVAWLAALLAFLVLGPPAPYDLRAEPESGETETTDPARESAIEAERLMLYRLKTSIKSEGYFSARINLNVWRKMAMDAGVFDREQYEEFKRRIYSESAQRNMSCYRAALLQGNLNDARICLHIWSIHSKVIETYDPELHEKLKSELK